MYLTASRPDITFAVSMLARFQSTPTQRHEQAVKRVFRYLKGYPRLGLWYSNSSGFDLSGYTDSDFGGCGLTLKSTSGGCQYLGNRLVSWQCKKQSTIATSTAEAEYVAASVCCSQMIWIQHQLLDYGLNLLNTPIFCDNESVFGIVKNPIHHSRTKHIAIRYHFIRNMAESGYVRMEPIRTEEQKADIFTKVLDRPRLQYLIKILGLIEFDRNE